MITVIVYVGVCVYVYVLEGICGGEGLTMALSPQQFNLNEGALTFKVRVWGVSKEPKFRGLGEFGEFPPLETAVALEVSRVGVL